MEINSTNLTSNINFINPGNNTVPDQCDDVVGLYAYACFYYGVHDYFSVILCCFGIPANLVNIIILTRKSMRTPINIILTGIAVSDLLTMFSYLVFAIHFRLMYGRDDVFGKYTYGWALFLVFHICLTLTTYTISIWLGVCMSVIRYMYVSSVGTRHPGTEKRRSFVLVIIVFAFSIIAYIPQYAFMEVQPIANLTGVYRPRSIGIRSTNRSTLETAFVWIFLVAGKWIPCFLIIVFGIILVCTLHKSKKRTEKLKGAQTKARLKQHTRTTAMLLVIILMYIISEIPQTVVLVIGVASGDFLNYMLLADTIDMLCLINNSVNIILYCAMSKQFRDMLWSSLCCIFQFSDPKNYMSVQTTVTHTSPCGQLCHDS
ncbi:G-protein coupled receptor dmsr-1-like [Ostrea edulis]|uniref:G-protein coupled receptor dmsr-1-like n=1 Tax=Ostrea edulis TaxID=37623 RepID=UPI0020958FCE|nr:G-protein coupled receptor dmsr-1-like [Ostrea edulis]